MRILGINPRDIAIAVIILGVASGVIIGISSNLQRIERDKIRLSDAQSVMNALEIYKTLYGTLPETKEHECEGWDIGSTANGSEGSFIKDLSDKGVLTPPLEKFDVSKCSYRYQKFTNNGCGENVSYSLFGLKLEGTKNDYRVKDVIDPCYPDIYRWTSDAHWIAFMIKE